MDLDANCDSVHFAKHIFNVAGKYCRGVGLDLGFGKCLYPGAIGIDNGSLYPSDLKPSDFRNLSAYSEMDYVFSSHALEHCPEWEDVIRQSFLCLKQGGYLFLYLPWAEHYPLWRAGSVGHVVSLSPSIVREAMYNCGFVNIEGMTDESTPDSIASFWLVGEKP